MDSKLISSDWIFHVYEGVYIVNAATPIIPIEGLTKLIQQTCTVKDAGGFKKLCHQVTTLDGSSDISNIKRSIG